MKKAFEKILERLEEEREYSYADFAEYVKEYTPCLDSEYSDFFDRGLERAIKVIKEVAEEYNNGWIPCSERFPDTDKYILLSFSNFSIPLVGRYEEDEDGSGSFYIGDEMETCLSQDLFVNAWQPLPEPYKESEKE